MGEGCGEGECERDDREGSEGEWGRKRWEPGGARGSEGERGGSEGERGGVLVRRWWGGVDKDNKNKCVNKK